MGWGTICLSRVRVEVSSVLILKEKDLWFSAWGRVECSYTFNGTALTVGGGGGFLWVFFLDREKKI